MRSTLIFAGSSCPELTGQICTHLGMSPARAELGQFANGETSVRILTSVREQDVFVVQSGSPRINDSIMELLIMISACKGGSANKITAVVPYFPYSRQSKKKSQRSAITARMLANLLNVAGVKHVITVDLHASQMQGFFKGTVDNLHAEPLIARWIRHNISNWREGVVVSKNPGGTKRVASLADALKLNFGIVTTDKRRVRNMMTNNNTSIVMNHFDGMDRQTIFDTSIHGRLHGGLDDISTQYPIAPDSVGPPAHRATARDRPNRGASQAAAEPTIVEVPEAEEIPEMNTDAEPQTQEHIENGVDGMTRETIAEDEKLHSQDEITQGRLVQGHIVDDDFPSPALSTADASQPDIDPMTMSHASSFFAPDASHKEDEEVSDEEEETLKNPKVEHMITLVGDVRDKPVIIIDDMIDKPGSWVAAAETVVKRGGAKKVFCMATHGVFGGDCLAQMQACECIDKIVVTNSFPISEEDIHNTPKLVVIDLSLLLAEAIRRNHYGESISPLFQQFD
ncbi:Ribose-phosphate diphosphokinase [Ceratocystis lukuohia]